MKPLFRILVFLCIPLFSFAQQKNISGTVTHALDGSPLSGASVLIRGTQTGVATDSRGHFNIIAGETDHLVFSFVGMESRTIAVTNKDHIEIALSPLPFQEEEALVIAFGKTNTSSYTGAAQTISHRQIENRAVTNLLQALDGTVSGLQVASLSGQAGSVPQLRIRGFGSIYSSQSPLIIVDGVPYANENLPALHPDDLENISILKDASSAALYGSRGANGIILVTTKQGKNKRPFYHIHIRQGLSTPSLPEYKRVNAYEYYPLMWEAYRNTMVYRKNDPISPEAAAAIASYGDAGHDPITTLLGNNPFNLSDNQLISTAGKLNPDARLLYPHDLNWRDAMVRTGYRQDYSLSAGGSTYKNDYYLSMGYTNEKGYIIRSSYERISARANLNVYPLSWLKTGLHLSGSIAESARTDLENNTSANNPFYFIRNIGPIYPIYQHSPSGDYLYDDLNNKQYAYTHQTVFPGRHILEETQMNKDKHRINTLNSRAYAEITFLPGLKFTFHAAYDFNNSLNSGYENKETGNAAGSGRAQRTNDRYDVQNYNQLLAYKQSFHAHHIDLLTGHESFSNTRRYLFGKREMQIAPGNDELDNFTQTTDLSSHTDSYRTEGYFMRLNYDYKHTYFLSLSGRRDGSSRFHPDSRWGNFWSAGIAWLLSEEQGIKNKPWINHLKIRSSYGQTGNDQTDSWYAWQNLYDTSNNGAEAGFIQNTAAGNKRLKWETNNQFDIAAEFALFNRLEGCIEFFHRNSKDLLFNLQQPLSEGILTQWQNAGQMYNRGIEIRLSAKVIDTKGFRWTAEILLTHFRNKVTRLPQKEISLGQFKLTTGKSIADYWLRKFAGVDPENGDALYLSTQYGTTTDINQADFYYCGSAIPKAYGSIYNLLTYKSLELSFCFNYRIGGKIYDSAYAGLMHSGLYGNAFHRDILKRWQQPGDQATVPRLDNGNNVNLSAASDRWLTDGSFIALKNISLQYRFPYCQQLSMHELCLYCSGENLFMISRRKGMDPQSDFNGLASNTYPPSRIITLGVRIEF